MPAPAAPIPIDTFAAALSGKWTMLDIPLSYYTAVPMPEEDLREFIQVPFRALPVEVLRTIGLMRVVLVPFLQKPSGSTTYPTVVQTAPDPDQILGSASLADPLTVFFAIQDETPSGYHQVFFHTMAELLNQKAAKEVQGEYRELLRTELDQDVHGEVADRSFNQKQELPARNAKDERPSTSSRKFKEYAAQSFTDTVSLYLHGICCDIDVETGPRQMPSKWLRKRLETLYKLFPPPDNRPVFPEHLSRR